MAKQTKKKSKKIVKRTGLPFVTVSNRSYGKNLKGTKIYYEGRKPSSLNKDGRISLGKNILETLGTQFDRYRWIITEDEDSIKFVRGIYRVRISQKTLRKMTGEQFDRSRDIKNDIIKNVFAKIYPEHFKKMASPAYVPGSLSKALGKVTATKLSSDDRDALNAFLPDYISSEAVGSVSLLNAATQIKTLKELAEELLNSIGESKSESWWQTFIHKNILLIQQGYIKSIEKMNIAVGGTKYPDFLLVTHDSYLDIMEIKKPDTSLLKQDKSRDNYYLDTEISKAVIQIENYIEGITKTADAVRSYIKDHYDELELKIVRPRGIILAGDSSQFKSQKEKDDFRLLCQSMKNVTIVTYDELHTRLMNYIKVLEEHAPKKKTR
jgi:hypothetical protein